MALRADSCRYRVDLVQVGRYGNVSAQITQLDGAMRGSAWSVISDATVREFLARPNQEIPAGTPLIRLDRTTTAIRDEFSHNGPTWCVSVPCGHIKPPYGELRSYSGEPWTALRGCYAAVDVYAQLATQAGIVVGRTNTAGPS